MAVIFSKIGEDGELNIPQVQRELANYIINREWCNFVVYSNGVIVINHILIS